MELLAGLSTSPNFIEIKGVSPGTESILRSGFSSTKLLFRKGTVIVPLSLENCYILRDAKIPFTEPLRSTANKLFKKNTVKQPPKFAIKGLRQTLRPFQVEGVQWIDRLKGRCILADEMGLGKTVQVLAWLQMHPENRLAVIVCPASLKLNWEQEVLKWMDSPRVFVASGRRGTIPIGTDIVIINYEILHDWVRMLTMMKPSVVAMDEMHYVKSAGSKKTPVKRTVACMQLCKGVPHVIGITGTPIENTVQELFVPCSIIKPRLFPSEWHFKQRYCDPKHTGFGWEYKGTSNTEELHRILTKSILIRRLKKDVLTELPDKTYAFVPFNLANLKEYKQAENQFVEYLQKTEHTKIQQTISALRGTLQGITVAEDIDATATRMQDIADKANPLAQIETLKQLAAKGIYDDVVEWLRNFAQSGEKIVVFVTHKSVINALMNEFKGQAVKIDGSCTIQDRHTAVQQFQNNKKIQFFFGNIKASGVGLTLTAASNVALYEYPWNPGAMAQAIDRVHRITQKQAVNVHFFTAVNTVVEKMIHLLHSKQKIADNVLSGKDDTGTSLLLELINEIKAIKK